MSNRFTTQTVLDSVLKSRGLSSSDTEMHELPARWSAVASHLSSFLQCENNPLECYTAMYEAVISQPCLSFEQNCQCGSCSERVTEFFHLGPCSHKLCKACLRKMFDQLNDECLVCNEPIRELAFCKQPGSMPPPPALVPPPLALPTKATPAPAPACEECPVFASILKKNGLPPDTSGIVHGYKKIKQINLLEDDYISSPPTGQTLIPEEDLIYLRDYMKFQFLHFFEEVDASETIFCAWKGGDAAEHQLECPLREDTCKNKALGCSFMQPYIIVAYHGINCENICLYESQPCPLCNKTVLNKDMYTHEVTCSKKLIEEHKEKVKSSQKEYIAGAQATFAAEASKENSPMKSASPNNPNSNPSIVSPENRSDDDIKGITIRDACENMNVLGEMYCDLVTAARPDIYSSTSSAVNSSTDVRGSRELLRDPTEIVVIGPAELSPEQVKDIKRTKSPKSPKRSGASEKNDNSRKERKGTSEARVLSYEVCSTGSGHPFVVYKIELPSQDGGESVVIHKRMKEIKAFHKRLQRNFPSITLPKLPQDRPWALGGNKLKFVQERSRLLEAYCGDINHNAMIYKSRIYKDYINEQCAYVPITYALKE